MPCLTLVHAPRLPFRNPAAPLADLRKTYGKALSTGLMSRSGGRQTTDSLFTRCQGV